jgi:cytochrome c
MITRTSERAIAKLRGWRLPGMKNRAAPWRLYGLPEAPQTGYQSGTYPIQPQGFFPHRRCPEPPSMDSFELNKVLGAVLFTCLVTLALNITAGAVFAPVTPEKPGYEIAVPETQEASGQGAAPAEAEKPIAALLASADPKAGQNAVKKCMTCHTFGKDEPNRVGPNLHGVVGRDKASHAGFAYSDALKSKGGKWTFEDLNDFITNPKKYAPGTKMSYAGDARASDRANIIAYLNQNSDSPLPLPKVAEAPADQGAAPAAAPAGTAPANPAPAAPAGQQGGGAAPAAPAPAKQP